MKGDAMRRNHNVRTGKKLPKNINPNGNHDTLIDIPIKERYQSLFNEAIKEFNQGKRKDRQIKDYYEYVKNNKKLHNVYEAVIWLGNRDNHLDYETSRTIFEDFLHNFRTEFPQLEVIGFHIHGDELGAVHAHLDYIPVHINMNAKREPKICVSMSGALEDMGLKTKTLNGEKKSPISQYKEKMSNILDDCVRNHGIDVIAHNHKNREDRKKWKPMETYTKEKDLARIEEQRKKKIQNVNQAMAVIQNKENGIQEILNLLGKLTNKTYTKETDMKTIQKDIADFYKYSKAIVNPKYQKVVETITNRLEEGDDEYDDR